MRIRAVVVCLLANLMCVAAAVAQGDSPPDATPGSMHGLVLDASGRIRPGVPVRARPDGPGHPLVDIAGSDGGFDFTALAPGNYVVDVVGDPHPPAGSRVAVRPGQRIEHHVISGAGSAWSSGLVVISILAYVFALLAFRYHNIVHTNRELLRAQLENLAARIPLEADPRRPAEAGALKARVLDIWAAVESELTWREWFFWSRGREIGAWTRLHEVERQLVAFLVPSARAVERAATAEADLRTLASPSALALADRLRATLVQIVAGGAPTCPIDRCALEHLKQQLAESLTVLHSDGDTRFATLMEWHNKAMWLVYLSLLVILVVGVAFHHEELFLIGAAGGLMSRMARALFREDVPNDYGASWTTLFLSPLLGAISAWFGVALIMWLTAMNILDDAMFGLITWDGGSDATLIGTGFVLGFSERLFTSLLSSVEGKVTTSLPNPPGSGPAPGGRSPLLPAGRNAAARPAGRTETRVARIVRELDLPPGARVAFMGDRASAARAQIAALLGAGQVFDVTLDTIADQTPFDSVLIETLPAAAALTAMAARLGAAVRAEGRVVVVGRTPAALFDADAATQRARDHAGPALVSDVLVSVAGLSAQEPPAPLSGTDPVEWLAGFVKAGADAPGR